MLLESFQEKKAKGNLVCQWIYICRNCSFRVTIDSKYECFMRFCNYSNKKQISCHFCYVAPMKPSKVTAMVLYVFFHTECTRDLEKPGGSFEHITNLMCSADVFKMRSGK